MKGDSTIPNVNDIIEAISSFKNLLKRKNMFKHIAYLEFLQWKWSWRADRGKRNQCRVNPCIILLSQCNVVAGSDCWRVKRKSQQILIQYASEKVKLQQEKLPVHLQWLIIWTSLLHKNYYEWKTSCCPNWKALIWLCYGCFSLFK